MKAVFRKLVLESFRPLQSGIMEVVLPDGEKLIFGGGRVGLRAVMRIQSENFFRRCVLFGPIGFAEAYIDGEWETPDLAAVIGWFILNAEDAGGMQTERGAKAPLLNLLNSYNRLLHQRRPNSLTTSRKNISEHYDLSNDFFKLWLDPTMTYSSALFEQADIDLQAAQIRKYDHLCQSLQLGPDDHVLEVGTGWGGFSIHAASTYGCKITTITISQRQHDEAVARIAAAGLSDRVQVLIEDYRKVEGQFDKIVSIEMIEAVGDRFLDTYFDSLQRVLAPDGMIGLQMITCPDRQYRILRDGVDFIQKHIFPGSLLVSQARVTEALNRTGSLNLHAWKDMAPHYAKTLGLWCERFEAERDAVVALGFDERFIRKWRYYLRYCEAAFATRNISVVQAVYARPNNLRIASPVYSLGPIAQPITKIS
ncbi:MAG: class I SAM-dependent methyltransferase [Chthoniobacterales bacterium]